MFFWNSKVKMTKVKKIRTTKNILQVLFVCFVFSFSFGIHPIPFFVVVVSGYSCCTTTEKNKARSKSLKELKDWKISLEYHLEMCPDAG